MKGERIKKDLFSKYVWLFRSANLTRSMRMNVFFCNEGWHPEHKKTCVWRIAKFRHSLVVAAQCQSKVKISLNSSSSSAPCNNHHLSKKNTIQLLTHPLVCLLIYLYKAVVSLKEMISSVDDVYKWLLLNFCVCVCSVRLILLFVVTNIPSFIYWQRQRQRQHRQQWRLVMARRHPWFCMYLIIVM